MTLTCFDDVYELLLLGCVMAGMQQLSMDVSKMGYRKEIEVGRSVDVPWLVSPLFCPDNSRDG